MPATIYRFPSRQPEKITEYRIPLYNDREIETAIICLNIFSGSDTKYNLKTLSTADPEVVMSCLTACTQTTIFSDEFNNTVKVILNNIEKL